MTEVYNTVRGAFVQLAPRVKVVIIAVLIGLVAWGVLATRGCASRRSDAAVEEREQERDTERAKLEEQITQVARERDAAIARADVHEKAEQDLRAQVKIHEIAAAASGANAAAVAERIKADDEKFTEDMRNADIDVDYCVRIKRICERTRRLYPGRAVAAECTECP